MLAKTFAVAAAAIVLLGAGAAGAAQIVLTEASVIGSTGNYGGFPADNILDQQTGDVFEVFGSTYWLNPDNGPANAYITIDLGQNYWVGSFDIFNAYNAGFGDRGTGNFTILGGNSVAADPSFGGALTLSGSTVTLVSGTLTNSTANPVQAQTFAANVANVRFIQFRPTSVATVNPSCCGANNYGLTELRVYDTVAPSMGGVPEPGAWALMIGGFAGLGGALRLRRRAVAA